MCREKLLPGTQKARDAKHGAPAENLYKVHIRLQEKKSSLQNKISFVGKKEIPYISLSFVGGNVLLYKRKSVCREECSYLQTELAKDRSPVP